jgi:hypothetical protein
MSQHAVGNDEARAVVSEDETVGALPLRGRQRVAAGVDNGGCSFECEGPDVYGIRL